MFHNSYVSSLSPIKFSPKGHYWRRALYLTITLARLHIGVIGTFLPWFPCSWCSLFLLCLETQHPPKVRLKKRNNVEYHLAWRWRDQALQPYNRPCKETVVSWNKKEKKTNKISKHIWFIDVRNMQCLAVYWIEETEFNSTWETCIGNSY